MTMTSVIGIQPKSCISLLIGIIYSGVTFGKWVTSACWCDVMGIWCTDIKLWMITDTRTSSYGVLWGDVV